MSAMQAHSAAKPSKVTLLLVDVLVSDDQQMMVQDVVFVERTEMRCRDVGDKQVLVVRPERIDRFPRGAARLGLLRPRGVFSALVGRHADKKLDPVLLDDLTLVSIGCKAAQQRACRIRSDNVP
jgi:hypothetical protein